MTSYYFWLVLFGFFFYLVATDQSIAQLVVILGKWSRLQYEKLKWWILYNPQNPVIKYLMYRKSIKMAKELMKEMNDGMD